MSFIRNSEPGVYIEENPNSAHGITGVSTSITAFLGVARFGENNKPTLIHSFKDFQRKFGGISDKSSMSYSVYLYFKNGGNQAIIVKVADVQSLPSSAEIIGNPESDIGLYALNSVDEFNLLCIPPIYKNENTDPLVYRAALDYCKKRKAILIVDPPKEWTDADKARDGIHSLELSDENSVIYFPRIIFSDPISHQTINNFVPCGAVAGVIARTDSTRGVWKSPDGMEATLESIEDLSVHLDDSENGDLNVIGINCLRNFPSVGIVVWGARTLVGSDDLASEWKYLPVRRTALFIEESIYRGTQWVVFEPDDESLWSKIRLSVDSFMHKLFRKGAFQGTTPKEAYFVKCDNETNTQSDIDNGRVNIMVGFAPIKPAEFIIIRIQQITSR